MSDPRLAPVPPAGWYPDPRGLPQRRWWTGSAWTQDVAPNPSPVSAPPDPPALPGAPGPSAAPLQIAAQAPARFALPAAVSDQASGHPGGPDHPTRQYPSRRELRERMARASQHSYEPHTQAPFAMPAAPAASTVPPALGPAVFTPAPSATVSALAVQSPGQQHPVPGSVQPGSAQPGSVQPGSAQPGSAQIPGQPPAAPPAPTPTTSARPPIVPVDPIVPVGYEGFTPQSFGPLFPAAPAIGAAPATIAPAATAPAGAFAAESAPAALGAGPGLGGWPQALSLGEPEVPYRPFEMIPKASAGVAAPPERRYGASVWSIALLPLVIAAAGVGIARYLLDYYTVFMAGGLGFVFALIGIMSAIGDARELRTAGFERPPAPGWILLTPLVYLWLRAAAVRRQARRSAVAPLVLWLLVVVAITVGALAFPDITAALLAPQTGF
ncbi:MAG: DUF2510 domain-containing protein [Microbacteriaceae bacterium]